MSAFQGDRTNHVYVEITLPRRQPLYFPIRTALPAGQQHRFAVLELAHRPGWWRAWLDGTPVSKPVYLPGSADGTWGAQVEAESWNDQATACNLYAYAFRGVKIAAARGGLWKPLTRASVFQDAGYRLRRHSGSDFLASSVISPTAERLAASAQTPAPAAGS
jgi:hypothetical protein